MLYKIIRWLKFFVKIPSSILQYMDEYGKNIELHHNDLQTHRVSIVFIYHRGNMYEGRYTRLLTCFSSSEIEKMETRHLIQLMDTG